MVSATIKKHTRLGSIEKYKNSPTAPRPFSRRRRRDFSEGWSSYYYYAETLFVLAPLRRHSICRPRPKRSAFGVDRSLNPKHPLDRDRCYEKPLTVYVIFVIYFFFFHPPTPVRCKEVPLEIHRPRHIATRLVEITSYSRKPRRKRRGNLVGRQNEYSIRFLNLKHLRNVDSKFKNKPSIRIGFSQNSFGTRFHLGITDLTPNWKRFSDVFRNRIPDFLRTCHVPRTNRNSLTDIIIKRI